MGLPEWVDEGTASVLRTLLQREEYGLLAEGADRHGTYDWVSVRRTDDVSRYVILSLSPAGPMSTAASSPTPLAEERWRMEVSVGAEDDRRYERRAVAQRAGRLGTLLENWPPEWLRNAFDTADALTGAQLTLTFAFPTVATLSSDATDSAVVEAVERTADGTDDGSDAGNR